MSQTKTQLFDTAVNGPAALKTGAHNATLDSSGNLNIGTGNLIVASGKGIDFSATSGSGTSELLDDYEEGTWTVTCNNGITVHSGIDLASYTKVGRKVTVLGQFRVNSSNTNQALIVNSLPFACASNTENEFLAVGSVRLYQAGIRGTCVQVVCVTSDGTDDLYFNEVRDNASDQAVAATDNGYYMFNITYFTA